MRGFRWSTRHRKSTYNSGNNNNNEYNDNNDNNTTTDTTHLSSVTSSSSSSHDQHLHTHSTKRKSSFISGRFSKSTENITEGSNTSVITANNPTINTANTTGNHNINANSINNNNNSSSKNNSSSNSIGSNTNPDSNMNNNSGSASSNNGSSISIVNNIPTTANVRPTSTAGSTEVFLDNENYDTTIFKVGWLNKSVGFIHPLRRSPSNHSLSQPQQPSLSANNNDTDSLKTQIPSEHSYQDTVIPDYRVHKAVLKGSVLSLYKNGLHSNIKYFDPLLKKSSNNNETHHNISNNNEHMHQHNTQNQNQNQQIINHHDTHNDKKQNIDSTSNYIDTKNIQIKFTSDSFPHPNLKLDKNGKIISGTVESLSHAVLFQDASSRSTINLILILPLLENFNKFLSCFVQYTKLYINSKKHHQIIVERISLLIKTIAELLSSFLLIDSNYQLLIQLIKLTSSEKLISLIDLKISKIRNLIFFTNLIPDPSASNYLLNSNNFLQNVDIDKFTETFHRINLKFDKIWSPRLDYSLLYDSNFTHLNLFDNKKNLKLKNLNPLVFNNNENFHLLGRLLTIHVMNTHSTPSQRAKLITKWIKIGCKFEQIGDMVSWLAIATIICSLPILRLQNTWNFIDEDLLKILFKDWIPTIIQLDRRQFSSKSTQSVFILAPPNLNDPIIRNNVISYFGDLMIHADELPSDSKLKYLEKKINRTKNAFHKWEQKLHENDNLAIPSMANMNQLELDNYEFQDLIKKDNVSNSIFHYWRFHLSQPNMNVENLMKLSLQIEPSRLDAKSYSSNVSQRSPLLSGSYLPIIFNDLLQNYSLFTKNSLIGASGMLSHSHSSMFVNESNKKNPPPRSSARISKTISISEPLSVVNSNLSNIIDLKSSNNDASKQVTGFNKVDMPTIKEISMKQSNKQKMMRSIRDILNIDMDLFHISNDLIFKSTDDNEVTSRPASIVIESAKRFSQLSISNNTDGSTINRDNLDSQSISTKSLENMDFFKNISKISETISETTVINTVLKSGSLDKIFDLLVLTINIFSNSIDTDDLKNYFNSRKKKSNFNPNLNLVQNYNFENTRLPKSPSSTNLSLSREKDSDIGLLDYAFVRLSMDNTNFTETFFNTYKTFTTATSVIENLAKRFIKAKNCAISISYMLLPISETNSSNSTDKNQNMNWHLQVPDWDIKITNEEDINYIFVIMIHIGVMEATLHFVKNHYSDLTDDLEIKPTFLDFFKIMEQEVTVEWPNIIKLIKNDPNSKHETLQSIESHFLRINELFYNIKESFQNQLYKPVGVSPSKREALNLLDKFSNISFDELSTLFNTDTENIDNMLSDFTSLDYKDYPSILSWINRLDCFVTKNFNLANNGELFITYEQLNLFSTQSLTALFNCSPQSETIKLLNSGSLQLVELSISNIFTWITSITYDDGSLLFDDLPTSVKVLINLHKSLTAFFTIIISDVNCSFDIRLNRCCVVLQILNYVRWKNSSLDLFDNQTPEDPNSSISPHIPSFIETAISNAMVTPESRSFELAWRTAYSLMNSNHSEKPLRSIYKIMDDIDDIHIKSFIEIDMTVLNKPKNLSPCPGWFISRLLEISQFVPNMSMTNSKLINFDKRRFVHNFISNIFDLIPHYNESEDNTRDEFGSILYFTFDKKSTTFRQKVKNVSILESKQMNFNDSGLFNELLINEVDKLKREQRKRETLLSQERESKKTSTLQETVAKNKRNSVIIPNIYQSTPPRSVHLSNSTSISSRDKRGSVPVMSSRNSMSATSHTGVSKKLGEFFRSPFFSSSSSNTSLNSILVHDVQGNGSICPAALPSIDISILQDNKALHTIRTFEIKSIVPTVNHRMNPAYLYSFKIVMQNGSDYMIQASSLEDLNEWVSMIKASKRYSFYSRKFKGRTHNKIFGVPLEDVCERESTTIPTIVTKLLEEIELRGLDEVGLYRIPGSAGSINALKNAFDEEGAISNSFTLEDDRWFEINAIAGCFKMYLRELPDSLFTNEKVGDFAQLAINYKSGRISENEFTSRMNTLLSELPTCYYHTMKQIVTHLNRVHQHVSHNRMDASNLAIVFSMSFIDQEDLASSMGANLGAIQTILQHFIKNPETYFIN
ncbi:hypothetical protein Kpol_1055p35 [Vanderwaltozyma polyspora DSM 70294]|uniref:Rho-GAP domain-containing protein n=1 Tax=Vanderwaltozyma polyspora (strain ATCC 22028 / DSM 70294 / BCRC 21397 / CBS 2163 / NBRC 10782 / NRRL Y-8283 / UCD 57-17) TaxID=436907 RepID=A7TGB0_VANPO|nr:uncharacterized protein Kpol_1055p35 [Vanderwaltozyma polyspora DSM 70294]EDO18680.1 hypothetical protein Kpol_1055p35 [Vanderwaltozyma polyspora DSM 70294]